MRGYRGNVLAGSLEKGPGRQPKLCSLNGRPTGRRHWRLKIILKL